VSDKAFGHQFWAITHFHVRLNPAADESAAYPLGNPLRGLLQPKIWPFFSKITCKAGFPMSSRRIYPVAARVIYLE
jgi:hypothetical protein